jgi:hypothetical protein
MGLRGSNGMAEAALKDARQHGGDNKQPAARRRADRAALAMDGADQRRRTASASLLALVIFQIFWVVASAYVAAQAADGRYVALGMTEASDAWKRQHPKDENFVYVLDTATGRIEICSDVDSVCRSLAASERESQGIVIGRFAGVKVTGATKAWKATKPADDHLIYTLDTKTAKIQVCGDTEGSCAMLSNGAAAPESRWPKVVMLYRRADSAAIAGRIYDRLISHYGEQAVFMDIYNIPFAANWRERVNEMSLNGGVLVVLVGPRWLGPLPDGQFRINDEHDPVRMELETALRANISVFPVLVEGATMPKSAELPDSIRIFSDVNAATVDTGRDFNHHVSRLIESIDKRLADRMTAAGSP